VAPERLDIAVGLALAADDERPDLRPAKRIDQLEPAPSARVAQVVCGVVTLLAAAVVYMVVISNQVSSGKERLGQISGELVTAEHDAAALKPYADFATATMDRRKTVTKVASARFDWDRTLRQLSQVAPGDVWLTSAKGTLSPATAVDGGSGASGLRSALPGPALELAGCGKRESDVPKYMDRLYAMSGVHNVGFEKSERVKQPGNSASGSAGTDACGGSSSSSTFSLVTSFKQSAALAAAAAQAAGTASTAVGGSAGETTPPTAAAPAGQPAAAGAGATR
jgi:Tfp pilus assembly protein PilN